MQNYKNVLLIGLHGVIGRKVVEYAVKKFFTHCLLRGAPQIALNSIFFKIVEGDVTKAEDLEAALEGKDAVISAFGSNNEDPHAISEFTSILIAAMKKKGIRRLVAVGSSGCLKYGQSLYLESPTYPEIFKVRAKDHYDALKLLFESDLEFIIVCPHRIDNSDSEELATIETGEDEGVGARALGKYMVQLVEAEQWRRVIGVRNK